MCNPTSQPPRRDLYELETTMAATERPSFLPKPKVPRIAGDQWMEQRAATTTAVYNANYSSTGEQINWHEQPWSAMGPFGFRTFKTQPEALAWVLQEARK